MSTLIILVLLALVIILSAAILYSHKKNVDALNALHFTLERLMKQLGWDK